MAIQLKRAYDAPSKSDGFRILVDRLWPRGVTKAGARIDLWLKAVAPSTTLRKWFAHDPDKWPEFRKRYFKELASQKDALSEITSRARKGKVTLVYSAKDTEHNDAVALKEYIAKAEVTSAVGRSHSWLEVLHVFSYELLPSYLRRYLADAWSPGKHFRPSRK